MSAVEFGLSEHLFDHDCPHLVAHEGADIFSAFSDEFAVGKWLSQVAKGNDLISRHADKASRFHSRSNSRLLEGYPTPGVVNGMEPPSRALLEHSDIPWTTTRSTASPETGGGTSSRTKRKKAVADPRGTAKAVSVGNAIISYSTVRKVSSTTYLRRMHLSRDDAVAFFPESKETLELIFATDLTRCVSPEQFKVEISVSLHDGEGRRWPVVLECLRSAGQRHVRLNKGWSEMCRANGISVGKRIRLALWEQASGDALATVTIV
jgi:hypothetical protein